MSGPEFVATVVVCEDDRVTLDLLCDRLASDRYEPLAAGTAEEALRLCRHQRPDLLVVDLELPDGEGPELLRRIREAHWLQNSRRGRSCAGRFTGRPTGSRSPSS
jgi:DNA-binding response OmpR family regulator